MVCQFKKNYVCPPICNCFLCVPPPPPQSVIASYGPARESDIIRCSRKRVGNEIDTMRQSVCPVIYGLWFPIKLNDGGLGLKMNDVPDVKDW